jgi:hypothetical protein
MVSNPLVLSRIGTSDNMSVCFLNMGLGESKRHSSDYTILYQVWEDIREYEHLLMLDSWKLVTMDTLNSERSPPLIDNPASKDMSIMKKQSRKKPG